MKKRYDEEEYEFIMVILLRQSSSCIGDLVR